MAKITLDNITEAVINHGDGGKKSPRLHEIYSSLIRHLHDFAREVNLSTEELEIGRQFLFRLAQPNQDFPMGEIHLMSDCLGLSELCVLIDDKQNSEATESNVEGPFYFEETPARENGAKLGEDDEGDPLFVNNRVLTHDGTPIAGAEVYVWQPNHAGYYFLQREEIPEWNFYGKFTSDKDGAIQYETVIPGSYPIPVTGPTGEMLDALGRHGNRPAHIHYKIKTEGHPDYTTMAYMANSPYIDSDTIFSVKDLIYRTEKHESEQEISDHGVNKPFYTVDYDFVLPTV